MPVLKTLIALTMLNSPPAYVADARFSVAVWCTPTCSPESVDALRATLDEDFVVRRRLPWREASDARVAVEVLPADLYGRYPPEGLAVFGDTLTPDDIEQLNASQEVVVIGAAVPRRVDPVLRQQQVYRAALALAESQGGLLEDIDTRELYNRDAWRGLRVDALDKPIALWEQFTLLWNEDGDRVVTLGLRKFGLHEYVLHDVPASVTDDVLVTLVLIAATELEGGTPPTWMSISPQSVENQRVRLWLEEWQVFAGEPGAVQPGEGWASVRLTNIPAQEGDPEGPLLLVTAGEDYKNGAALAQLMDRLWGWAEEVPQAAPQPPTPPELLAEPPVEGPLAVPIDSGWSGGSKDPE
ncbi:MAG: hypothetical protein H6739_24280 [Alphaproteobacteria bacterium]|nr:hypothetical protein [Alphaproteobacteria bacterium]